MTDWERAQNWCHLNLPISCLLFFLLDFVSFFLSLFLFLFVLFFLLFPPFSLQDWAVHFSQIFNRCSLSLKRDLKPRQTCNSLSTFDVWIRVRRDNSTVSSEQVYIWWNGVGSLLTQSQGKEARESHIVSYSPQAKSTSSYIMYNMLYLTKDSPCIRIHISTIDSTHESRASHHVFLPPTLYDPSYHTLRIFQSPPLSRSSPFCLFHADRGTMTMYLLQFLANQCVHVDFLMHPWSCARIFGKLEFESLFTRLSCGSLCPYARC